MVKRKNKRVIKRSSKIKVRIKDFGMNKKSRKGKYFYVKEPKKVGKYYKKKEGINKKDVIEFYKRGIVTKRGGVSKKRLERERKLDKLAKKYPNIEDSFGKRGYGEYTVKNAQALTPNGIRTSYGYLLMNRDKAGDGKGIVRDKELLELLTRGENINKWKHRVLFEIYLTNENGEVLATINNTKIKTLGEIKKEVIDEIKVGRSYDLAGVGSPNADSTNTTEFTKRIVKKGYRVNRGTTSNGKVKDVKIKMIFRKGS